MNLAPTPEPTVGYTGDNANRLTGISQGGNAVGISGACPEPSRGNAANRRAAIALPGGVGEAYTYDQDSRVVDIAYTNTVGGNPNNPLGDLQYAYDDLGRVTAKTGSMSGTNLPNAASSATYNADNEMITINGTAICATPPCYDANGNLTAYGSNYTLSWDARNHLASLAIGANTASFTYDAFGRRVSKTIAGTTTQFVYDRYNPIQELNGANPPAVTANLMTGLGIDQYFVRTDQTTTPPQQRSFLTDTLRSTLALVDSTAGSGTLGNIMTSYQYDPFGNTQSSGQGCSNSFQFAGRENDQTGLYYMRARYYAPSLQRFISQDPMDFLGGMNLYGYTENQPTDLTDPSGLDTLVCTGPIKQLGGVDWCPICHEFLCVIDPGLVDCKGLDPADPGWTGGAWPGPGVLDPSNPNNSCQTVSYNNTCFDNCVEKFLNPKPGDTPHYELIFSNCQEFANFVLHTCNAQCGIAPNPQPNPVATP